MCDPITVAGLALTAGGVGASYVGQRKAQGAIDSALLAEQARQRRYDQQAAGVHSGMANRYENVEGQTAEKSGQLGDYFTGSSASAAAPAAMPASENGIVAKEIGKKKGEAADRTAQQGAALGELRAFGDVVGGIGREQQRDMGELSTIYGFKKGSQSVLPYEVDEASHAGDLWKLFGDVGKAGGQVMTGAGLSRGPGMTGLPSAAAQPTWLQTAQVSAAPAVGWSAAAPAPWPAAGAAAGKYMPAGDPFKLY